MNLQENIRKILKEVRVPRSERVELYKDKNIIVVVPLTHRALQKYAHQCQWCINDDLDEWEDYHKGKHAVIIQRNPKKPKIGITGNPTASEIFLLAKWDNNQSSFDDVCQMLDYEFRNDRTMLDYYVTISNDINNFATNIVYYSPETGIYDQEDNFLWNFNYEITDIPNVTPEVIKIMDEYLQENEEITLQENIRRILREESSIPLALRRRVSYDDIEEAFDFALEEMARSMTNPNSVIYKEKKHTTLGVFAKFVIDEMVTIIEQEYFNHYNRVYFNDDNFYYDKIRKPLLKRYGKRIKEKYNEVKRGDINESILKDFPNLFSSVRIEEKTKLEKEVKRVIDKLTEDNEFPENFYGFAVTTFIENKRLTSRELKMGYKGDRVIHITGLFKKPFSEQDANRVGEIMRRISPKIKAMFKPYYDSIRLYSTSTIDSYKSTLYFYENEPYYKPYNFK